MSSGDEVTTTETMSVEDEDDIENQVISCTLCSAQMNQHVYTELLAHPKIDALICRRCCSFYARTELDEHSCFFCGEGERFFVCRKCKKAFCYYCIDCHFGGDTQVMTIENSDGWDCFVCEKSPQLLKFKEHLDKVRKFALHENMDKPIGDARKFINELERLQQNLAVGNAKDTESQYITALIGYRKVVQRTLETMPLTWAQMFGNSGEASNSRPVTPQTDVEEAGPSTRPVKPKGTNIV